MNSREQFREQEGPVSRMEYDDGSMVLAADVGADRAATVDVLGDTVIVVTDDDQYEFEIPTDGDENDGDAQAFMKNGVLTVEVEA
jgi:hypothetical protein